MSYVEYRSLKVSPQDSLDDLKALSEICRETRKAVVNSQHAARWEFMYSSAVFCLIQEGAGYQCFGGGDEGSDYGEGSRMGRG